MIASNRSLYFKWKKDSLCKKYKRTQNPTFKSMTEIFMNNKNAFLAISYLKINSESSISLNDFDVNYLFIQEYIYNEGIDTFE